MANSWLRLWHDMPNDPKWRTIARLSGQSIALTQAVYLQLLVSASEAKERGEYTILIEDIASALDEQEEAVSAIICAMQSRVLEGARLTGWDHRQPVREDGAIRGKKPTSNYVYYVATTESDVVKVGISSNPWSRIKELKIGSHEDFELLATLKTSEKSERKIHEFFKESRKGGEWFYRSEALNLLIENTKKKKIQDFETTINFLKSLPPDKFEILRSYDVVVRSYVVTTDKDKDKDKDSDKDLKHTQRARESPVDNSIPEKTGDKIRMHSSWQPDPGFLQRSAEWGRVLTGPDPGYTAAELTEFCVYWTADGGKFAQVQWEQKFSLFLTNSRASAGRRREKRDVTDFSSMDYEIPHGYNGR